LDPEEEKSPSIIEALHKPSKGEEVIKKIKPAEIKQEDLKKLLESSKGKKLLDKLAAKEKITADEYVTRVKDGVEVLDVKAIEQTRKKREVNKFGIPIDPDEEENLYKI
jgi:hypothetical protein